MQAFQKLVQPKPHARIVDLGGSPTIWNLIPHDYEITMVNLPGCHDEPDGEGTFHFVDGDACDLSEVFADQSFDVVFSNSVIEHVGDESRQAAFAEEVHRLAPAHWIQTPSDRFPLEVHTGVLCYWRLPAPLRDRLHQSWETKLPEWYEMIRETRVLTHQQMATLFPHSETFCERFLGLEKSYALYQPAPVR